MTTEFKNPTLEKLKGKFETPKDAYTYLYLSKLYVKEIVVNPDYQLTPFTAGILEKQKQINSYIEKLSGVVNTDNFNKEINQIFSFNKDFAKKKEFINKMSTDEQARELFHLDLNGWIETISGTMGISIRDAATAIKSWDQVEDFLNKYQIKTIPDENTKETFRKQATDLIEKYNFSHFNIQSFYTQKIEEIGNCAKELAEITQFSDENIGQKKLGVHLGYEMDQDFSAYCNPNDPCQFLLFKPNTISSTFGHEWMHFIDYALSENFNMRQSASDTVSEKNVENFPKKLNAFHGLVSAFKEDIEVNDHALQEKTKAGMLQLFKRFLPKYILNEENLKATIDSYFEEKIKNPKADIEKMFKNSLKTGYPHHYIAFVEAEMDLYVDLQKTTNKNNFLDFAKKADVSLIKITKDSHWNGYTASNTEMLARSFETFLLSKKEKNNVTVKMDTNFYPQDMEAKFFNKRWEVALNEIRAIFHPELIQEFKKAAI